MPNRNAEELLRELICAQPEQRTIRYEENQTVYWVKNFAVRGFRDYFAGTPAKLCRRERAALTLFRERGLHVPQVLARTETALLLSDTGPTLSDLLRRLSPGEPGRQQLAANAGEGLAVLHKRDLFHGRPALRDLTYTPEFGLGFLDFEMQSRRTDITRYQRWDLLVLCHSYFRERDFTDAAELARATVTAYRAAGGERRWQEVARGLLRFPLLYRVLQAANFRGRDLVAVLRCREALLTIT